MFLITGRVIQQKKIQTDSSRIRLGIHGHRIFGQCGSPVGVYTLVLHVCRMWRSKIPTVLTQFCRTWHYCFPATIFRAINE